MNSEYVYYLPDFYKILICESDSRKKESRTKGGWLPFVYEDASTGFMVLSCVKNYILLGEL